MKNILLIILFLISISCLEKEYYREIRKNENIVSVMKVKKIQYFNKDNNIKELINNYKIDFLLLKVDTSYIDLYCIYYIEFDKPILKNEREFCFIDTINKYQIGDKFPKN